MNEFVNAHLLRYLGPDSLTIADWRLLRPGDRLIVRDASRCGGYDMVNGQPVTVAGTELSGGEAMIRLKEYPPAWCAGRFRLAQTVPIVTPAAVFAGEILHLVQDDS